MIIFHEGLPGAGKSYEAVVHQIIPALKKGRKVFAYIEGLNHEKIAECCGITVGRCRDLLIPLARDQVPTVYEHVENDALVVLDELQNFWPTGRQKLSDEMTQFVTEHRHRGLDILAMGQDLRDCHNLWKRRISQKVVFVKLDAVGMGKRYRWTVQKATTGEKFQNIRSGVRKYEPEFFGTYASHTDDTDNTDDFHDARANIFKTPLFKYVIPGAVIAVIFGINYLVGFFNPDPEPVAQPEQVQTRPDRLPAQKPHSETARVPAKAPTQEPEKEKEPEPLDYVDEMAQKTRFRLAGIIESPDGEFWGRVDALDNSMRVKERFTVRDLRALGWTVEKYEYGLLIRKSGDDRTVKYVVRPWPIDPFGRVSQAQQQRL